MTISPATLAARDHALVRERAGRRRRRARRTGTGRSDASSTSDATPATIHFDPPERDAERRARRRQRDQHEPARGRDRAARASDRRAERRAGAAQRAVDDRTTARYARPRSPRRDVRRGDRRARRGPRRRATSVRGEARVEAHPASRCVGGGDVEQDLADDGLRGDAVELRLGVEDQAMREHRDRRAPSRRRGSRRCDRCDAAQRRASVGEREGAADADAQPHLVGGARRVDDARDVVEHEGVDVDTVRRDRPCRRVPAA